MTDNQKRLIHSAVIIMLIPLLSALMEVSYKLFLVPTMMPISMELQQLSRILIFGVPSVLLIYYGYTTGNKVVATLCGVLLFPLNSIYAEILFELFDPEFIMAGLNYWFRWKTIIDFSPFTLICGLMGYFASIRTKASLLAGVCFGILLISILLLID
ncbi:MAG: hypothetical protein JXA38_01725 [Methanosarcinaceae archaeon]|nr:hypothetical protein [Methanosarcinaceae archaeon]